ncbi:MAG: sodium:proton antiporter [Synergistetes bacterium]|nr:sodium:proton antiporter [Synergistota bacterium]MCX8127725.1 sodium:proton antiporter [Synergistota bacterium]MDW8191360.1 sodium:proton antiporter [Synergistota bacterium]
MPFVVVGIMLALGLYAILFNRNLIKIAIGLSIVEAAVNLFLITLGYVKGAVAPIYTMAPAGKKMVLPTPQALTLTAIVIGLATTAMLLSLIVMAYKHYGTLDVKELRKLKG